MKAVRKRSAFTLLEMMVVLLLLAVVSGIGFLSVRSSMSQASRQHVISRIIALDAQERTAARSNPAGGRLAKVSENELSCRLSKRSVRVTGDLKVGRLMKLTGRSTFQSVAEIPFVLSGNSPTYAIELTQSDEQSWWVVVLGISGQAFELESESELLALAAVGRVSRK